MSYWPHLAAVLVGAGLTVQVGMNATVRHVIGSPVLAAVANFVVGLAALLAVAVAGGARWAPGSVAAVPAWAWFGGLLGAVYVASTTVLGPRLGAAALLALTLAGQMVAGMDETLIDQEIRRIFQPSAQRMLEAAKVFVQAWREMQSVEAVLLQRVRLTHTRVTGDSCTRYDHELIRQTRDGELLPTLIAGIPYEDLRNLNDQFTHTDNELVAALDSALRSAGFDGWGLKVYHPKTKGDERRIYAPDPNPPKKHLGHGTGLSTVVRVDV